MKDVPKAKAIEDTRGLLQAVKHHETDELVGVHIVGPRAADMIPEATLAVKHGLTVDDVIDTTLPFPTFSEAFKHACQAFRGLHSECRAVGRERRQLTSSATIVRRFRTPNPAAMNANPTSADDGSASPNSTYPAPIATTGKR
nr:hypothetical protein [Halomarina sp. BCD28]